MSFGDGLMLIGHERTAETQVEDAAGDIASYFIPNHCQVEEWGVLVTEDFVAQATDPVVALQKVDKVGGTVTELDALTIGNSNTKLRKGDGSKVSATAMAADTELDNGQVVVANGTPGPIQLRAGEFLRFRHKTAATGAGGAYRPYAVLRVAGPALQNTNVWSEKPE